MNIREFKYSKNDNIYEGGIIKLFMDIETFKQLLNADKETEHLEFKEAKQTFDLDGGSHSLCNYCTALANEGGGKIIFGVTDKIPRTVVGTSAFQNLSKLTNQIFERIHRRIDIEEITFENKRVLILTIPSRPLGQAVEFRGQYFMRMGESLRPMTGEQIKKIIQEAEKDYSSKIAPTANEEDLSPEGIIELRKLLNQSARVEKKEIQNISDKQLLVDLGLIVDNKITLAALILLGKEKSIKRILPHAEIRFGYKTNESEIRNQDMVVYSGGYLLNYQKIWEKINSRNLTLSIPGGIRIIEKRTFDEETIREALNNAIIHRDYSENETIFITQTPQSIAFSSPGGLLEGVTISNIAEETKTRNKLIADILFKCDFVEQFGHGVNLMIKNQLSSGKALPDYSKTDKHHVVVKLDGKIQDLEFAKFVYIVAYKKQKILNDQELLILNKIKNHDFFESNSTIMSNLLQLGLVESLGNGKYILSSTYYSYTDKKGEYTRRKGLDKEAKKELILKHLEKWEKGYMTEFKQALGNVPKPTINSYLTELKAEDKIELIGNPQIVRGKLRAYWKLK